MNPHFQAIEQWLKADIRYLSRMKHFKFYNKKDILSITRVRRFESRIGERIGFLNPDSEWPESLAESPARFILLGIPEDIGVKANQGIGGSDTAWLPFLNAFLNCQSNDFLTGEELLLLGHFDFGDLKFLIESHAYDLNEKLDAYRHAVATIDEEVENIIKYITAAGKIPIVVGGGANNAYPILKAVSKGLHKNKVLPSAQMNAICLSALAGFGATEGRHSGNPLRYAYNDGYLGNFALIGLQECFIPQNVLFELHGNNRVQMHSFEDIFLYEKYSLTQAFARSVEFTSSPSCGIEISLDVIRNTLTSFGFPTGISTSEARQFLHFMGTRSKAGYLHISEGACQLHDGKKDETTGKLIAVLISDFVKAQLVTKK